MKKARLPNGQVLTFDDDTSDEVIQNIVKKLLSDKTVTEWDHEHVKNLVRDITNDQGERDLKRSEMDLKRAETDYFGPAIEKQTGQFEKLNKSLNDGMQSFVKKLLSSQNDKLASLSTSNLEKVLGDIAKQVVNLSGRIDVMTAKSDKNTAGLIQAVTTNTKAMQQLVTAQKENTQVLKKLVTATQAPRTIVRNTDGKVKGIK